MKRGIDLSTHNQVTDWDKIKENVDFVILRAGYGKNNIDEKLVPYAATCMEREIPLGLYWFSYAYTVEMAKKEAQYCIQQAKKYQVAYPIAFDFEYDSVRYAERKGVKVTRQLVMDMTLAFCREVKEAGYIPMVYTNKDYANQYFNLTQLKEEGYAIWYAYYNKTCDRGDMALWQYTSSGSIQGISGKVDMNISYVDYVDKSGWIQEGDIWKYQKKDGSLCKNCWQQVEGLWYHFDPEGIMQIGWLKEEGKWYFLKNDGSMANKEMLMIKSPIYGEETYIFAADGHMLQTNERGAAV